MSCSPGLLQPNTRFRDRYQVLRVIKAGGMGAVYEVMDDVAATRRALKVMLPSLLDSEELRARFALEARISGIIESAFSASRFRNASSDISSPSLSA